MRSLHTIYPLRPQSGFTIILSVLIVSAVALSVGLSLMYLSTSSIQSVRAIQTSGRTLSAVNACIEDALMNLRKTEGAATAGSLTIGSDECTYTIDSHGGTLRTIHASSTVDNHSTTTDISVSDFTHALEISAWRTE